MRTRPIDLDGQGGKGDQGGMMQDDDHPLSRPSNPPQRAVHDRIAHDLGVAIVGGRYQPGDSVPGAERYSSGRGVSRTAYREAVRVGSAEGLGYSRTKSGPRVSVRLRWSPKSARC